MEPLEAYFLFSIMIALGIVTFCSLLVLGIAFSILLFWIIELWRQP